MTSAPTANAWVDCDCGERHWGRYGAAGLLLVWRPPSAGGQPAEPEVLLQHRAAWTHMGGTWALPGGARSPEESPAEAAVREAGEEAGVRPEELRTGELLVVDHGSWSYTYVFAEADARLVVTPTDEETEDLAWVPIGQVAAYPLHPLFAQAWPDLRQRLTGS